MKQDEFVEAAVDATHWIEEHWKVAVAAVVGAVVVIVAVFGWINWSRHDREVARETLARGVASYRQAEERNFDRALLGESLKSFDEVVGHGESKPAAQVARLYKGAALQHLDRRDEAIAELESLTAENLPPSLEPTARQLLARLYTEAGRTDEAVTLLEGLAGGAEESVAPVPQTLMQLAEVRAREGDTEAARRAWQRVVDEFGDTPSATIARERLAD